MGENIRWENFRGLKVAGSRGVKRRRGLLLPYYREGETAVFAEDTGTEG